MTDPVEVSAAEPVALDAVTPSVELSAGAMLKTAREAAGLHIAALAVSLKVPVKKLEALEADRLDVLPDAVFVRALASSVCRTLKINPVEVLAKLPQSAQPRLTYEETVAHTPFPVNTATNASARNVPISGPLKWSVGLLVIGALAIGLMPAWPEAVEHWQNTKKTLSDGWHSVISTYPAPPVAVVEDRLRTPVVDTYPVAAAVPATGSAAPGTPNPLASSPQVGTGVDVPAVPAVQVDASATAAVQRQPVAGIVIFKARSESWVEVTDRTGTVALRRTLGPGESVGATGPLPLAVVVGRANVTEVQIRGKSFDLQALTKDNVARFEVK